jgi:demethylmenaquinone methyltransferase/2-methoxy-6-polyprenyl-1,4-benzoquinol methylase
MVAFGLARRGATVVGLDQSEDMLAQARARLAEQPGKITFVQGEAEDLPFADGEFDALTFTYLLRYVDDRPATMRELARVVKPGGRIGMVEFGVPASAPLRAAWRAHTRLGLPLLGRAVSPAWVEVGRFLGPNIEEFHAREPDLQKLWTDAGIAEICTRHMSFGAGIVMSGTRKPDGQRPT